MKILYRSKYKMQKYQRWIQTSQRRGDCYIFRLHQALPHPKLDKKLFRNLKTKLGFLGEGRGGLDVFMNRHMIFFL